MKFNIKKYLYSFFAFVAFQQASAQVIFKEDFGQSSVRTISPYVPQGGVDASLGKFKHGSSFYYAANTYFTSIPGTYTSLKTANTDVHVVNDGYYTIVSPKTVYNFAKPSGGTDWDGNWWAKIADHTGNANGSVMIVNAGQVKNQFYRRV